MKKIVDPGTKFDCLENILRSAHGTNYFYIVDFAKLSLATTPDLAEAELRFSFHLSSRPPDLESMRYAR